MGRLPGEPVTAHIRTKAVRKRITVSKSNVKWFRFMEARRQIRQQQVWALLRDLFEGKPFHLPVSVNRISDRGKDRWVIIDGQHRIEAIKEFITRNPDGSVELEVHVYQGLTPDQERQVYDELNAKVVKQSLADRLATHAPEIPVLARMLTDFPVKVHLYRLGEGATGFQASSLLAAYLARTKWSWNGGIPIEALAKELPMEAYDDLKGFAQAWVDAFGAPSRDSEWARNASLHALLKAWHAARRAGVEPDEVAKRWKPLNRDTFVQNLARTAGLTNVRTLTTAIIEKMNSPRWKNVIPMPAAGPEPPEVEEVEAAPPAPKSEVASAGG